MMLDVVHLLHKKKCRDMYIYVELRNNACVGKRGKEKHLRNN